jgi:aminoglycoside 6'-N-acetyltransferase
LADLFSFRPITPEDIPLLHRWRNLRHVAQWWDPPYPTLSLVRDEYAHYMTPSYGVSAYIVSYEGVDMGYIQRWQVRTFPDYKPFVPLSDDSTGVDVFIGEATLLHQGLGTGLMRQFIRDYVFNDPAVPDCVIDPLPENAAAIRAYSKVGFVHEKTFTVNRSPVYFMRLRREDLQPDARET